MYLFPFRNKQYKLASNDDINKMKKIGSLCEAF